MRHEQEKKEGGRQPGTDIGQQIADVTEPMFYVVAVNPEKQHVAGQVHPAGMHEHRREHAHRRKGRRPEAVAEHGQVVRRDMVVHHLWRPIAAGADHTEILEQGRVAKIGAGHAQGERDEHEHGNIDPDQQPVDVGG